MAYDFIPGVGATYLDGSFKEPSLSTQPKILVLGSADSGRSLEVFNVTNVRQAETEFGADTDVLRGVHESVAQNADNVAIMRVGGTQGALVLTDSNGGTLTITPENRDDTVLTRYALILDGTGTTNRIYVYDLQDEAFVYDSSEILVINDGIVEVLDTGLDLFSVSDVTDSGTFIAMSALVNGDFTVENVTTMTTTVPTQGTDGQSNSLPERYAALNSAYHLLDYKDADFVVPYGVYIDNPNQSDGSTPQYFKGVPVLGESNDVLGWVWQYIYQGKLYTYMADSDTYFTDLGTAVASTVTVNTDLIMTADTAGVGGDNISILIDVTGAAGPTVTITEPTSTTLLVTVTDDGTSDTASAVIAINLALGLFTMANGQLASTLVTATGGAATLLIAVASTPLATGAGGAILTHADLTGDVIPAAVTAQLALASDAQLREISFVHQLGTFCRLASTTWKTMLGSISFLIPPGFSRPQVASWVGNLPEFTQVGLDSAIDSPGDNGTGLLGHRLMAGESVTGGGYRNGQVEEGSANDGYAFGGLIQTAGLNLPNGTDFAYGINDGDELQDTNRAPVDLGKHVLVTYDWPIHRNAFNGGGNYRGSLQAAVVGKIAQMPENEEPIGNRGVILKVTSPPRIHSAQLDQLAQMRAIGLRFEEGIGWILVSSKTAAHPDSDYTRLSTIRCVNRALEGIRSIAKAFIGGPFSSRQLLALQASIDAFLVAERGAGFNQGAVAQLQYSRSDRILGRLTIKLSMVPPFSIESITVETSLAADESEL